MALFGSGRNKVEKELKAVRLQLQESNNTIKLLSSKMSQLIDLVDRHVVQSDVHFQCARGGEKYKILAESRLTNKPE